MNKFVISSGHALKVRGASGYIDEVSEARKVVNKVTDNLNSLGNKVTKFHDDTSRTQSQNINTIVSFHNSHQRDLDVSVHFNAGTKEIGGAEVLYATDKNKDIAEKVSKAISDSLGIRDRGAKKRTDLGFLNKTNENAILLEICFVDTKSNVDAYKKNFDKMCEAIAESLSNKKMSEKESEYKLETDRKDDIMLTPTNDALNKAIQSVLFDWESKGLSDSWRKDFEKRKLTQSDALGLIFIAIQRGYLK